MNWPTIVELGVCAFIVAAFLYFNNKQHNAFMQHLKERDALLLVVSTNCHEVSDRSTDAVTENARVFGRVDSTLAENNRMLSKVNTALIKLNGS